MTIGGDVVNNADGELSLREAVALTNSSINKDRQFIISFKDTFNDGAEKVVVESTTISVLSKAQVIVDGDLTINGGTGRITLSRTTGTHNYFTVGLNANFTLRNLDAVGDAAAGRFASVTGGDLTLDNVAVSNMSGVVLTDGVGMLTVSNSIFSKNVGTEQIYAKNGASITIIDSKFKEHIFRSSLRAAEIGSKA